MSWELWWRRFTHTYFYICVMYLPLKKNKNLNKLYWSATVARASKAVLSFSRHIPPTIRHALRSCNHKSEGLVLCRTTFAYRPTRRCVFVKATLHNWQEDVIGIRAWMCAPRQHVKADQTLTPHLKERHTIRVQNIEAQGSRRWRQT